MSIGKLLHFSAGEARRAAKLGVTLVRHEFVGMSVIWVLA